MKAKLSGKILTGKVAALMLSIGVATPCNEEEVVVPKTVKPKIAKIVEPKVKA